MVLAWLLVFASASPASAEVPAVWKTQELDFGYQGFTTRYSCRGLKDKMESLLLYFGARREGLEVSSYGCSAPPYRPAPAVNLRMRFETLAPAPPGASGVVMSHWAERSLSSDTKVQQAAPQWITRGDCELVERFVDLVLPRFTHRTLSNLTTCIPNRLSGTLPNLREEVLVIRPEASAPSRVTPR